MNHVTGTLDFKPLTTDFSVYVILAAVKIVCPFRAPVEREQSDILAPTDGESC